MAAPNSTYNSNTDLSLGQVPQVEDEDLYIELLDIHNAIESLLKSSDSADGIALAYILKQRNNTEVITDYTVQITDGTIEVDASAGDITITLHPVADGEGYRYNIKRTDLVTTNTVTLVGNGIELIDDRANGIKVSTKSSYTVKSNRTGWNII